VLKEETAHSVTYARRPPHNDAAWRLSILNLRRCCRPGSYYRPFPQRPHGHLARPAEAGTFTRDGTGREWWQQWLQLSCATPSLARLCYA